MEFTSEFALLMVVVRPVTVICAMNFALAIAGERGTMLVPCGDSAAV